jgi:prohibitin 2
MVWILITLVLAIATGVGFYVTHKLASAPPSGYSTQLASWIPWTILTGGIGIILAFTMYSSIVIVDTGFIGITRTFGQVDGTLYSGANFILPWQDVVLMDTRVKVIIFNSADKGNQFSNTIDAFSQETQDVHIVATVNYQVAPKDAPNLFKTVGPNFYNVLIPPRVYQAFKDVAVQYPAIQIAPNREAIRRAVIDRLRASLAPYSINVVDVNINDISFSQQFQNAIEGKQQATQDALRAQQLIKLAQYQAQQAIAQAQGVAQSTIVRAQGQATANLDLAKSLTPTVLQYLTIQKLSDKISVILTPTNGALLLNPSQFIKP